MNPPPLWTKSENLFNHIARSEYFNTALNTEVGAKENSLDVKGCLPHVLAAIVDFMYGIEIDLDALINSPEDLESLLVAEFLDVFCSDRSTLHNGRPSNGTHLPSN